MIRIFQRLGYYIAIPLIPSTETLIAEDCRLFFSEQEGLEPNTDTHGSPSFRNLPSKSVTRQDSSADLVSQSLPHNSQAVEKGTTLQDVHHCSTSGYARIVPIDQQNVNSRDAGHTIDPEFYSDRSTSRVAAMFEKAHNFNIENAPITNIGYQHHVNISHQHINSQGYHGVDNLREFVSFSAVHDSSAQDPERRCHPGTRKKVLDNMRTWMDDPNAPEPILWLHGPAGVGKSAIAQTISYSYGQDQIGATFFFFRSDPVRNDGNRLFPTLAWQLALSVPIIKDRIAFSLEKSPDLPRKTIEVQFELLITQPFSSESTTPTSTRVIVIDGLDECSDVKLQERILKIIGNAVADTSFPLRFIISSRPEAHIQDFFDQFKSPTLKIDLAKVDDAFRDIKMYFTSEFARIAVEQQLDSGTWPDQVTLDALVSRSSGQFVYAATVMKYVGDKYESAVAQLNVILGLEPSTGRSPFSELDTLYTEILQRQPDQNFLKEFLPVLVARSMLEGVKDGRLHEDDAMLLGIGERKLHRKLRGMHSVLKFEPFIDVHHKSFLDFLNDSSRSGEYHVSKHFANRRYMERITDLMVKAVSKAMAQPDSHEADHFKPRFATVIKPFSPRIELPLNDLDEILRPLRIIQENLLQLPNMSFPWKPRACDECWTFYLLDDLLLHLEWFRGTSQLQEPKFAGVRPLTAMEEKQSIPQLDSDACLSLLLANLRGVELSLDADTIGLVRALVCFNPIEVAMKVRSIADAQNLVELICCLNKNDCFNSWFGAAAHNATRLALAIYGRVPVLPRAIFLDSVDLDSEGQTYQGKTVNVWPLPESVRRQCFDAFIRGSLSHCNIGSLLGICLFQEVLALPENAGTLREWQKSANPSVSQIQQILFEVAKAIQYIHSLGTVFCYGITTRDVYVDSDNHVKVHCTGFCPSDLCREQFDYSGYDSDFTLEDNVRAFGKFFYQILFSKSNGEVSFNSRPEKPEIPDNVWQLIQWCCAEDLKERPTMDQVVREMEFWISLGQFTLSS